MMLDPLGRLTGGRPCVHRAIEHASRTATCPVHRQVGLPAEVAAWSAWRSPLGPSARADRVASNGGRVTLLHSLAHPRPEGDSLAPSASSMDLVTARPTRLTRPPRPHLLLTGSCPVGPFPTGFYRMRVAITPVKPRRGRHDGESHRSHVVTHPGKKALAEESFAALPELLRRYSHR